MDGINFSELNNVLDYIYNGELKIYQEELDRFLQIAKRLKLQGLLSAEDHETQENIKELTTFDGEMNESENKNFTVQTKETKIIAFDSEVFQNIQELDTYINKQFTLTEQGYKCNICNKTSKKICNIKEHIEIHINGLSFNCDSCGQALRSRKSLRNHQSKCGNKIKKLS